MEKKDIYEHLAKIYLDTPLKRQERVTGLSRKNQKFFRFSIVALMVSLVLLAVGVLIFFHKKAVPVSSEKLQVLVSEAVRMDFNFDPAKKSIYTVNLNKANLIKFHQLEFSVKKIDYKKSVSLRIEFSNTFNEKSEVYIKDILSRWQNYKIPFTDFKNISDWSEATRLSFIIEEWNSGERKGALYLDNVRLSE